MRKVAHSKNWLQQSRYSNRGSAYLFAPMVNFNVMAEVGDTPPQYLLVALEQKYQDKFNNNCIFMQVNGGEIYPTGVKWPEKKLC